MKSRSGFLLYRERLERSFQVALENLNERLKLQFKGIAEMMEYLEVYAGEGQDL
ncbi:hypothetical protein NST84_18250 [Paenibacillus sp. FSL R7-0345]|uniref:hypothetical protein n=1 Tax=Paenibacillus sp. FSL R7-0345 TaxID=2954535 RepID=UPI00315A3D93